MRKIGKLEETQAKIFSNYLLSLDIENTVRSDENNMIAIWVHDEEQIQKGKELLNSYIENPHDEKYSKANTKAKEKKQQKKDYIKRAQKNFIHVRSEWRKKEQGLSGNIHATIVIIIACLVVAIISKFGEDTKSLQKILITEFKTDYSYIYWHKGLPEIFQGEVWRFITPIFIHFGAIHLIFNMLAFSFFGGMIERIQKWWFLLLQVLTMAMLSNICQYYVSGPFFGGMSGVAFGLFGYIWMRYYFNPYSGYYMSTRNVQIFILWLLLCFTGAFGPIANTAHTVGLVTGMLWGISIERKAFGRWLKSLRKQS